MSTSTSAATSARDHFRDWRTDAACREADPELFFPEGDSSSARSRLKTAKLICRGCPVSATCLNWALANGQEAGIWGGLTEDERRTLRRRGRSGLITPFPSAARRPAPRVTPSHRDRGAATIDVSYGALGLAGASTRSSTSSPALASSRSA